MYVRSILIAFAIVLGVNLNGQSETPQFFPYHGFKMDYWMFYHWRDAGLTYEFVPAKRWGLQVGFRSRQASISYRPSRLKSTFSVPILASPGSFPAHHFYYELDLNYYLLHKRHEKFSLYLGPHVSYEEETWVHPDAERFCAELGGCDFSNFATGLVAGPQVGIKGRIWRNFYVDVSVFADLYSEFGLDTEIQIRVAYRLTPKKIRLRKRGKKLGMLLPHIRVRP